MSDGNLFLVDSQLVSASGSTKDFVCTFIFDQDGHLVKHVIELVGVRGAYPKGIVGKLIDQHVVTIGSMKRTAIWVRPFRVESHGVLFGLIPRQLKDGGWRVEFMPGNTLSFYPPWEAGEYDT